MGILRPHVSRHVSGRAPRRGRRPRRPASAHPRIPAHSRLSLRRGRRPRRPVFRSPIAGCTRVLHVCLRRPYFFQQRKKYGKERRQKPSVFGFPFRPIVTAVQKGSAPNRLHSYPRCRSCVPRLNAPNGHTPPTRISSCLRSRTPYGPASPTARFPFSDCGLHPRPACMPPAAIFLSTAKEIWKRTPPKTIGFWISLSSNCNCGAKRFRTGSPALLSLLPLLRTARKLSSLAPYRGSALHPTYFYILRPEGPHLCRCWQKRVAPESEMSPPRASAQNDTPPALPEGYRSSHDLKTCLC